MACRMFPKYIIVQNLMTETPAGSQRFTCTEKFRDGIPNIKVICVQSARRKILNEMGIKPPDRIPVGALPGSG